MDIAVSFAEDVCSVVPTRVCTHGCVGDAHVGVLCQCPSGRGGINCDQPGGSRDSPEAAVDWSVGVLITNHVRSCQSCFLSSSVLHWFL